MRAELFGWALTQRLGRPVVELAPPIVTSLGGTLRAESREGQGTTLTVILPAAPEETRPE